MESYTGKHGQDETGRYVCRILHLMWNSGNTPDRIAPAAFAHRALASLQHLPRRKQMPNWLHHSDWWWQDPHPEPVNNTQFGGCQDPWIHEEKIVCLSCKIIVEVVVVGVNSGKKLVGKLNMNDAYFQGSIKEKLCCSVKHAYGSCFTYQIKQSSATAQVCTACSSNSHPGLSGPCMCWHACAKIMLQLKLQITRGQIGSPMLMCHCSPAVTWGYFV